jgi:hypothetical protein
MKTMFVVPWSLLLLQGLQVLSTSASEAVTTSVQPRNLQARIVGGSAANSTRYPYYTSLTISAGGRNYLCGGTLVAEDMVLSAAHCVEGLGVITKIVAWVNNTSYLHTGHEYKRTAIDLRSHPQYDAYWNFNDVLMIKLDSPVTGVPMVQMNKDESIPVTGQPLTVFGVGMTSLTDKIFPKYLMEVAVNAISYQDCNDEDSYLDLIWDDFMLCAGVDGGGKDSCLGDSGAPLIVQGGSADQDIQVGIVSWGEGCGLPNKPGVYARISTCHDWIQATICQLSSNRPSSCPAGSHQPSTRNPILLAQTPAPTRKPSLKPSLMPVVTPSTNPSAPPTQSLSPTSKPLASSSPSSKALPSPPVIFQCFSGETTVVVKSRGRIKMKDLQVTDEVLVSIEHEIFEPVYAFGHRSSVASAEYHQFQPSNLELSANHMVFVKGIGAVPASMVMVGDQIVGGGPVSAISKITSNGMYAPFTASGRIVVNGVLASSYISFQDSHVLVIGSIPTGITYQWLAHIFQFPHRLWCHYLGACPNDQYTETGISLWVDRPLDASMWLFNQHWLLHMLLTIPLFLVCGTLHIVELMWKFVSACSQSVSAWYPFLTV